MPAVLFVSIHAGNNRFLPALHHRGELVMLGPFTLHLLPCSPFPAAAARSQHRGLAPAASKLSLSRTQRFSRRSQAVGSISCLPLSARSLLGLRLGAPAGLMRPPRPLRVSCVPFRCIILGLRDTQAALAFLAAPRARALMRDLISSLRPLSPHCRRRAFPRFFGSFPRPSCVPHERQSGCGRGTRVAARERKLR